jgi:CheY-like chemotaxis protein
LPGIAHDPHVVLVVDDDAAMREAMVAALASAGMRAVAAADGREALTALEGGAVEPCLIVLDLRMPTMDGWEFREHQLRDRRLAAIPVVVVSSYADPRREATSMGALAGLRKPIEVEELSRLLAVACRR